ncbi:MAG TPA: hypothetical protein VNV35_00745 [Puia sp.]|nr:hypothetical protein [Puia sp.]
MLINKGLARALPLDRAVPLPAPSLKWRGWTADPYILPPAIILDIYGSGPYMSSLGYFCRKEVQIEKMTRLPLRFRLGSLQEVNRLEGKPGW